MPKTDKAEKDLEAVLKKIEGMPTTYAKIGTRLHETILDAGPKLKPRLWYGMPGYATGRSKPVVVFFRLDDGVMTFGLSEHATVETEGDTTLRPCAWFLEDIDDATLSKVSDLVRTAFG